METANAFCYNARSEVTDALMGTNAYTYAYDPIGNRLTASADAVTNLYAANALNQNSNITYQSNSLQPNSLSPSYDPDGNMLTNGPWAYTWDAENRMASACSNGVLLVTNVYDHQSRRIRKSVYATSDLGSPISDLRFLYDGWNVVRETIQNQQSAITNYYTWGLDLSGTPQGAGGVGGLLAVTTCNSQPVTCNTYYPLYDANGNVTAYLDATNGLAAAFEYDAFGNKMSEFVASGVYLPFQFSTKYCDAETGLGMYQLRPYIPPLGRWMSRDPIGEADSQSLYAFVLNEPIKQSDYLGLTIMRDRRPTIEVPMDSPSPIKDGGGEYGSTAYIKESLSVDVTGTSLGNGKCRITVAGIRYFPMLRYVAKTPNSDGYLTHERMHVYHNDLWIRWLSSSITKMRVCCYGTGVDCQGKAQEVSDSLRRLLEEYSQKTVNYFDQPGVAYYFDGLPVTDPDEIKRVFGNKVLRYMNRIRSNNDNRRDWACP